ncbi:MAG: hypothetical protein LBO04_01170 [Spirochaetaceae bacterium]|jgi:hypothetical protein|nr:hypothetical protein [Spirochaetaceae bacterium]
MKKMKDIETPEATPKGQLLELTPFVAAAIADSDGAWKELETIRWEGLPGLEGKEKGAGKYGAFYRQYEPRRRWRCLKAEALIRLYDAGGEGAKEALARVLQKGWRKIYSYVKGAPELVDFEKFYVALMRKGEKISADKSKGLFPPSSGRLRNAHKKDMLDGDFAVFAQSAILFGKKVNGQGPCFNMVFNAHLCAYEELARNPPRRHRRRAAARKTPRKTKARLRSG